MTFKINKDLKPILYPYMFVLKEGKTIQTNLFDYSLMMFHVGRPETIHSPRKATKKSTRLLKKYDNTIAALPNLF